MGATDRRSSDQVWVKGGDIDRPGAWARAGVGVAAVTVGDVQPGRTVMFGTHDETH